MKTIGMVTLVAAHAHLIASARATSKGGVQLADLQTLCIPSAKRTKPRQGWTFIGDWNKSVKPFYT